MKYIITEEQNLRFRLKRRLHVIDNHIEYYCKNVSGYFNICVYDIDYFVDAVGEEIVNDMYYNYFSDVDDTSEGWKFLYEMIKNHIQSHFKTIKKFYNKECGN